MSVPTAEPQGLGLSYVDVAGVAGYQGRNQRHSVKGRLA
jgi:hypothetical protein